MADALVEASSTREIFLFMRQFARLFILTNKDEAILAFLDPATPLKSPDPISDVRAIAEWCMSIVESGSYPLDRISHSFRKCRKPEADRTQINESKLSAIQFELVTLLITLDLGHDSLGHRHLREFLRAEAERSTIKP